MLGSLRLHLEAQEIGLFDNPVDPKFCTSRYHAVYVITGKGNPCKIGFSADPYERMARLQTSTPDQLHLAFAIWFETQKAARKVEQFSHKRLAEKKIKGEWFLVDADEAIDAISHAVADAGQRFAAHCDFIEFQRRQRQIVIDEIAHREEKLRRWIKAAPDKSWKDGGLVFYQRDGERLAENA